MYYLVDMNLNSDFFGEHFSHQELTKQRTEKKVQFYHPQKTKRTIFHYPPIFHIFSLEKVPMNQLGSGCRREGQNIGRGPHPSPHGGAVSIFVTSGFIQPMLFCLVFLFCWFGLANVIQLMLF